MNLSVVCLALALSTLPEGSEAVSESAPTYTILRSSSALQARRHRGDWEAPGATVLTFSTEWIPGLDRMIAAAKASGVVYVLVGSEERWEEALEWYERQQYDVKEVVLVHSVSESAWVRDYGPLQVETAQGFLWLDAEYASNRDGDDAVPKELGRLMGVPVEKLPVAIDGGGIISNGQGLCVMTHDSFDRTGISLEEPEVHEQVLGALGCSAMLLVPALSEEATKHVDMFAQFLSPGRVLVAEVAREDSVDDHVRMEDVVRALQAAAGELHQSLEIVRLPLPLLGSGIYRSYVNGLRLADAFLVPSYGDVSLRMEREVYALLRRYLPELEIIAIPADQMIDLDGAVHCVSLGLSYRKPGYEWARADPAEPPQRQKLARRVTKTKKTTAVR